MASRYTRARRAHPYDTPFTRHPTERNVRLDSSSMLLFAALMFAIAAGAGWAVIERMLGG